MATRRELRARQAHAAAGGAVPARLARFDWREWVDEPGEPGPFTGPLRAYMAAKRRWRAARTAWAREHDTALWPMDGTNYQEYQRITGR